MAIEALEIFPSTVDIEINGICNLNCAWCWGPIHDRKIETVFNEQWLEILLLLRNHGTRSVVFTGGETLLRKGIGQVLQHAKELGLRVTLSTNGTFLKRLLPLLEVIDDLGLPLDGHSAEAHGMMRGANKAGFNHFEQSIAAMNAVQDCVGSSVKLTIRTVCSKTNAESVPRIGDLLVSRGIKPKRWRWKIYQVSPEGPRHDEVLSGKWLLTDSEFAAAAKETTLNNPGFELKFMPVERSIKRYLLLDPSANVLVIGPDELGFPKQIMIGNVLVGFKQVVEHIVNHDFRPTDLSHGI